VNKQLKPSIAILLYVIGAYLWYASDWRTGCLGAGVTK